MYGERRRNNYKKELPKTRFLPTSDRGYAYDQIRVGCFEKDHRVSWRIDKNTSLLSSRPTICAEIYNEIYCCIHFLFGTKLENDLA